MTLNNAKKLQKLMPYKQIYFDTLYDCYRLVNPDEWSSFTDDEGCEHERIKPETLIPIHKKKGK